MTRGYDLHTNHEWLRNKVISSSGASEDVPMVMSLSLINFTTKMSSDVSMKMVQDMEILRLLDSTTIRMYLVGFLSSRI